MISFGPKNEGFHARDSSCIATRMRTVHFLGVKSLVLLHLGTQPSQCGLVEGDFGLRG